MKKRSLEEMMRRRAEGRRTQKQGIDFLREYREQPRRFLPLIDHQYRHVDEETKRDWPFSSQKGRLKA